MQKLRTLVRAPALTASGYGVHSRQVINALLNDEFYDVYLESVNWGNCAFVTEQTSEIEALKQCAHRYQLAKHQGQDKDWDLFITITIPNEFERRGKLNIGITAATETTNCSPEWLNKCNEMDAIIVPSHHAYKSIAETILNWQNKQTGETGVLKLQAPIAVCPEGFDSSLFFKKNSESLPAKVKALQFKADFNFLVVGQWGNGGFGDDRKNIGNTILYFMKAFQNRKDVGLVLKINMVRNSEIDFQMVSERIAQIKANFPEGTTPPIHLVHANFTDEEMAGLYNHPQIKVMLSLTHGEGFGLPLLEAAACELPIIATNWSGHLDFLAPAGAAGKLFGPVAFELRQIPDAAVWEPVITKESRWAVASEEDAIRRMRKIVTAYSTPVLWARQLGAIVKERFSLSTVQQMFASNMRALLNQRKIGATPADLLKSHIDDPDAYNVLYTMPMSTGDVFISTAVIDGLRKQIEKENKEVHIYFATQEQYAPVLAGNPNVHKVIPWDEKMMNISDCEEVFDLVLTPNVATQFTFSNWVRAGSGRKLAEEFANHCQTKLGKYFIMQDDSVFTDVLTLTEGNIDLRHADYITFHPGSGKGQWEARKYNEWEEVLFNLKGYFPDAKIVQVGSADEPKFKNIDVDLRGKTSVHQLACVIRDAQAHLSIDTFTMHLAAAFETPLCAIFGSSHAASTGPWFRSKKAKYVLLEAQDRMGCSRACYKYTCRVNQAQPCLNEIDSSVITNALISILNADTAQLLAA